MTPYSALAGGRLSKAPGETSKRLKEDSYAKFKYDTTAEQDGVIIGRVMAQNTLSAAKEKHVWSTGNQKI